MGNEMTDNKMREEFERTASTSTWEAFQDGWKACSEQMQGEIDFAIRLANTRQQEIWELEQK